MSAKRWKRRLQEWRGGGPIEEDLSPYSALLNQITAREEMLQREPDERLRQIANALREKARIVAALDELLVEVFALAREAANRFLGMRPFDTQVIAGIALHKGKLVEMQSGEGKTLAAVLPACLNALAGRGVHVLTFNDYLARRDADWMGPVYRSLGLSVGVIQEGMEINERREAYGADITYAMAKEAGFDFLRTHLALERDQLVHRPFSYAIVDEADSILIDEARVPLVIAGERPSLETSPYRIASVVGSLTEGEDWETDEYRRYVFLTERGLDRVEEALGCGELHNTKNYALLTGVNQALHARVLLKRDVDYIVRGERIKLVDEFTGRVVDDRRWPDGLQAALEAKEGLPIQPGGRILGLITLQHFLAHYPKLSGMTATAQSAAAEFHSLYGLKVVPISPNAPSIREDMEDVVFTHRAAKNRWLLDEIGRAHEKRRPVLVGTSSVDESESLAGRLREAGIECRVLNAKNDAAEAEIIARAGAVGAVTISTNMAGRGTDIKLGGVKEEERERAVELGGLYVIGTSRQESRRIDDQIRGRAARQGDPGMSRFTVSLEDGLLVRFGIDRLIPAKLRPARQEAPIYHPIIRREIERLQRIVEGQNYDIRHTLWRYSSLVERQRKILQDWRMQILSGEAQLEACARRMPERYESLSNRFGPEILQRAERDITLHHIDECWADHLAFILREREGIHLLSLARLDPLREFHKQIAEAFQNLLQEIENRTVETFAAAEITENGLNLEQAGLRRSLSTWTYLLDDPGLVQLRQMLFGRGGASSTLGTMLKWPLMVAQGVWYKLSGAQSAPLPKAADANVQSEEKMNTNS
jgi:preprotein translocase subunit SecA